MPELLNLKNIETSYGESQVLNGVSMEIPEGKAVALLGRNGMGKTTTVRSIMGFTPAKSGAIEYKNQLIQTKSSHQIAKLGIGLVPQGHRMFGSLSVEENLTIAARGKGWDLDRVYQHFPILKERAHHRGKMLSGGEQQLACTARALMTNPDLLILDEPSEGLAPIIINQVGDMLLELKEQGLSILLVEQNVPLALKVCDYVYIMSGGKVVWSGTADECRTNEQVLSEHLGVGKAA